MSDLENNCERPLTSARKVVLLLTDICKRALKKNDNMVRHNGEINTRTNELSLQGENLPEILRAALLFGILPASYDALANALIEGESKVDLTFASIDSKLIAEWKTRPARAIIETTEKNQEPCGHSSRPRITPTEPEATLAILGTNNVGTFFIEKLVRHILPNDNESDSEIFTLVANNPFYHQLKDSMDKTLLHFAAVSGNVKFTRHLVAPGAEMDVHNNLQKQTSLMFAVDANRESTVRELLDAHADISLPDGFGHFALGEVLGTRVTSSRDITISIAKTIMDKVSVDSLTRARRCISSELFRQDCPLYHFIPMNDPEMTRILLETGNSVDVVCPKSKRTALMRAVKELNLENVRLLLKWGADVNRKTGYYESTPLSRVPVDEDPSKVVPIIETLIAAGALLIDPQSKKLRAMSILKEGTREMIRAVLQGPIDLHSECNPPHNKTPLHYLAMNRLPNVLQELTQLDFDVNVRCAGAGCTMLHYAAMTGNASSLKFLLSRGADTNIRDKGERAPLYYAIYLEDFEQRRNALDSCTDRRTSCADILLAHGADPNGIFTPENVGRYYARFLANKPTVALKVLTPVLAKLALLEATPDARLTQVTYARNYIDSRERLKDAYEAIKRELLAMRRIEISHSLTLFDFFIAADDEVSRLARSRSIAANVIDAMRVYSVESCYYRRLRERFVRFKQLVEWRETMISVVDGVLIDFCNLSIGIVAEKIVDYMQDEKWRELL